MATTKYRALNNKQLDILRLLYRFRFATTDLLVKALQTKSKINMNERLKVLLDQELIGRNYEPEYHLLRKHATYYLSPKGINALKQSDGHYDANVLRSIRYDKRRSEQFIDYCLDILDLYCQLKSIYGDSLRFFTQSQIINRYDYFSEFTPSVYVRIDNDGSEHDYFLEYLQSGKPFFTVIKRLKEYSEYADSGEWEAGTDSEFPAILFVCDNQRLQNRLMKGAGIALDEADDDLKFYATTSDKLDEWQNLADRDEVTSLDAI